MDLNLLNEKMKFEDLEIKFSKFFPNKNFMNIGYCISENKFFFYILNTAIVQPMYFLFGENEKYITPNLLSVKIYDINLKHINKFKYRLNMLFKKKNKDGFYD